MSAYHQMGHDSWNIVAEADMYGGLILSPVNDTPARTKERLEALIEQKPKLDVILDPQLYKRLFICGKIFVP